MRGIHELDGPLLHVPAPACIATCAASPTQSATTAGPAVVAVAVASAASPVAARQLLDVCRHSDRMQRLLSIRILPNKRRRELHQLAASLSAYAIRWDGLLHPLRALDG